ncbi:hypothetical protein [Flexithrix dorotheae]|uniref:hypothetical protein n=1 Tax=Flexithrix dorotheae TaxID=70993 RepID=UPI000374DB3E|nr:hypothetical protein [Flexithrix dorotheae]
MKLSAKSMDSTTSQISQLILDYKFNEAEELIKSNFNEDDVLELLEQISKGKPGLLAYTFAAHLSEKHQNSFWHRIAASLAIQTLEEKSHAQNTSLYHILKAVELDPKDWELKEQALSFYPENLLPERYVKPFAEAVLRQDPTNELALGAVEMD